MVKGVLSGWGQNVALENNCYEEVKVDGSKKKIYFYTFKKENKYFRLYNAFNALKHAIDLSIIGIVSSVPLFDPRQVNKGKNFKKC